MKVLVLAPYLYDTAPGQRYRIEQWMPHLERRGVRFEFDAFMSEALARILYRPGHFAEKMLFLLGDYLRRLGRSLRSRRYDAIYLHREAAILGPAWIERLVAALGVPLVYDFDDAIWEAYVSPSNGYLSYLKVPQKTATICRVASHVVVGNAYLAAWARRYNRHVTVVPTTIDTEKYQPSCDYDGAGDDGKAVIGWTGSHSSEQYLVQLRPALLRLAERFRFRLEVVSAGRFAMDGIEVRSRSWRSTSEVEDLQAMQIGLMPLPDEEWTRGKCACKALQYMALGIPTVVSPVGVNRDVIRDGMNGLHASTEEEWVAQLARLLEDRALRRRLGEAGRVTVEREYSARVHAPRVLRILESVVKLRAGQPVRDVEMNQ